MNRIFISALLFLILFTGCDPKDKKQQGPEYDRVSMLTNVGNNIIIPNYLTFKIAATKLDSAVADFNAAPDATKLANVQSLYKDAYRAWQSCSAFELGPAQDQYMLINTNTFPTDVTQINANITSGSYSLDAAANIDAKGFPALDYLLYGTGADNAAILDKYVSDADAAKRKDYLAALASDIKTRASSIYNEWIPSGGNYINTFINASGTDVGSSVGILVNKLNYDLEIIKNYKVGIPNGEQSGGVLYPEKVEAYYSGISVELAVLQLKALQSIYLGKGTQGDGQGFDDYLTFIDASYNGASLSTTIKNQFTTAISKLEDVPDPLSSSVQNNTATVHAAYVELQKLVVLLKTDMSSVLGVLITYIDNDGD